MPRRKTNGKRRRSVRCTLCTPHRWMGNARRRFDDRQQLATVAVQEQVNAMQPDDLCPCCNGTGINGGERCEWCDGWGEYSHD